MRKVNIEHSYLIIEFNQLCLHLRLYSSCNIFLLYRVWLTFCAFCSVLKDCVSPERLSVVCFGK